MKLDKKDIRITIDIMAECESYNNKKITFVTLKHIPTGIKVTKGNRYQIIAKGEALEELGKLVFNAEPIK